MPDYRNLIRSLGLNDSEVAVYLAALEGGPAQAQVLVKKSGFSRPATYLAIEQLMQKGLMSSVLKGKRHVYAAEPPERLVNYGKSQVNNLAVKVGEIESALDDLRMMRHGERPAVKFYEGVEGLKAILQDLADAKPDDTLEIADMDAVRGIFSADELEGVQKILTKIKAKGRALLAGKVTRVREGVEARLLPKDTFDFQGDILIYDSRIAMVSFKGRISGVVIDNRIIADTYRVLFELAWRSAQAYPEFGK
jgi:sugar-specific transcriptional regulator TrmB